MLFSRVEIRDIMISVIALAIVFSYPEILSSVEFFVISVLTLGIAFMGHELSHKFVARRKGYWAEYKMWPQGLFLAVLFALATNGSVIFAAPGAVYFGSKFFFQRHDKNDVGLIGIAGIAFNLCLFLVLVPVYILTSNPIVFFAAQINVWLALFNLVPIPPLDGSKVMAWNPKIWAVSIAFAVAGFVWLVFFA